MACKLPVTFSPHSLQHLPYKCWSSWPSFRGWLLIGLGPRSCSVTSAQSPAGTSEEGDKWGMHALEVAEVVVDQVGSGFMVDDFGFGLWYCLSPGDPACSRFNAVIGSKCQSQRSTNKSRTLPLLVIFAQLLVATHMCGNPPRHSGGRGAGGGRATLGSRGRGQ